MENKIDACYKRVSCYAPSVLTYFLSTAFVFVVMHLILYAGIKVRSDNPSFVSIVRTCVFFSLMAFGTFSLLGVQWGINMTSLQFKNKKTTWTLVLIATTTFLFVALTFNAFAGLIMFAIIFQNIVNETLCSIFLIELLLYLGNGIRRYRNSLANILVTAFLVFVAMGATLVVFIPELPGFLLRRCPALTTILDAWTANKYVVNVCAAIVILLSALGIAILEAIREKNISIKDMFATLVTIVTLGYCSYLFVGGTLFGAVPLFRTLATSLGRLLAKVLA